MAKIKVRIINESSNPLPEYSTEGSAGMDIRANLENTIVIGSMERFLVPTGLFLELPMGYEAQIRPRSGMAVKQGITVLNAPGTIDSDYRGELKVILINLSSEQQSIHHGDRIAQMIVSTVDQVKWKPVKKLKATKRNEGGFGHTGKI